MCYNKNMIEVKVTCAGLPGEKFEGPLDLLLNLIEKDELDITKVSLAYIADSYIEHIEKSENIHPRDVSDFLLIASKLLLIKSKTLLPYLYPDEEDEIQEFTDQLKMYKDFLAASVKIEEMLGKGNIMIAREFDRKALMPEAKFSPPQSLKPENLSSIFSLLLKSLRPMDKFKEQSLEPKMSLEQRIVAIKKIILDKVRVSFSKAIGDSSNKTDVVVSFLAMLELEKQREVFIEQDIVFGEIIINKC